MFDLSRFSLSNMIECGAALRRLGRNERSMEGAAERIVRHLYDHLGGGRTGERACALVRFFKTHPYCELDPDLQRVAFEMLGRPPDAPGLKCLTLLATVGDRPEWSDREQSRGHRAIPLPSEEAILRAPMISQLIEQLGLEVGTVLQPDPDVLLDLEQRTFNVFHVPRARGSPFVPAQVEFVARHGIESVLGFGGVLPGGDLFAVILFSRVPIPRATADLFKPLALSIKLAVLPFADGPVFASAGEVHAVGDNAGGSPPNESASRVLSRTAALEQLLEVHERSVLEQAGTLEEALAESRQLLESAPDAIVITDGQGRIVRLNRRTEGAFGYTREELLGRPAELLVPNGFRPGHGAAAAVNGTRPRLEGREPDLYGRRKDGGRFPIDLTLSPLETVDAGLVIGIIRDLTERRRMQAVLIQAEKLASLGLLSAGVAHEINNPLAYVANNLAVLERDAHCLAEVLAAYDEARPVLAVSNPELADRIDRIAKAIDLPYIRAHLERMVSRTRHGVKRISDIVQNLRMFARLDQAAVDQVDLQQAIVGSLELIWGQLEKRHIVVKQQDGGLHQVVCAPAQINQVVLNLLVNAMQAIEATGRDGGQIEIGIRAQGDEVILEVADDGCGMPAEDLPRIFDPFFTTKPMGQGTGLGLAISHSIVADHGGRIEVESTPDRGSRFRIILPVGGGRQGQ
ncbi:ATP-binding protein [Singulisphaera sp. Ch08]|uniref:histidine kinase n=1 Tax=Singulisphaera sp. Ch08 TaxID=3120278 RepID=A0AAU7CAC3_9BACT